MSGFVGIIASLNFIMFIPVMFVNFYLNADLDSFKGKLNFTGVTQGLSLALLIWILVFTWIHDKEEGMLSQALIHGAGDPLGPLTTVGSGGMIVNTVNLGIATTSMDSTLNVNEEF